MIPIADPIRGCGRLREGGTYAQGALSPYGVLLPWSWTLGTHIIGAFNVKVSVPPRLMKLINLPATLARGRLVEDMGVELTDEERTLLPGLPKLPKAALIDHVGAEYYAPMQFAEEVKMWGPSRRVPLDVAKTLVGHTPLPILFTHRYMPIATQAGAILLQEWANIPRPNTGPYLPTFAHPNWGITVSREDGGDHWIVPVLDTTRHNAKLPTKGWGRLLKRETIILEATFGISWITRLVHIPGEDESQDMLDEIEQSGIQLGEPTDVVPDGEAV